MKNLGAICEITEYAGDLIFVLKIIDVAKLLVDKSDSNKTIETKKRSTIYQQITLQNSKMNKLKRLTSKQKIIPDLQFGFLKLSALNRRYFKVSK